MIEPVARLYSVLDPRDTFRPGLFGALPDKVSSSGADARAPLDAASAQAKRRRLLRRHQKVESGHSVTTCPCGIKVLSKNPISFCWFA